jgi:hypothetical protein
MPSFHDLLRVHAQLDDLEGHRAADGLSLLRQVHFAEAALADPLQEPVGADARVGSEVRLGGDPGGRRLHELAEAPVVLRQELLDEVPEPLVAPAPLGQHGFAIGRRQIRELLEDRLGLLHLLIAHGSTPVSISPRPPPAAGGAACG